MKVLAFITALLILFLFGCANRMAQVDCAELSSYECQSLRMQAAMVEQQRKPTIMQLYGIQQRGGSR